MLSVIKRAMLSLEERQAMGYYTWLLSFYCCCGFYTSTYYILLIEKKKSKNPVKLPVGYYKTLDLVCLKTLLESLENTPGPEEAFAILFV